MATIDGEARFAPEQFARAFQGLLDWVPTATLQPDGFAERLRRHFGCDPSSLPATSFKPVDLDRPDVQLALDVYLAEQGRESQLVGFATGARARLVELFCRDFDADHSRLDVLDAETDGASRRVVARARAQGRAVRGDGRRAAICQAQCADAASDLAENA